MLGVGPAPEVGDHAQLGEVPIGVDDGDRGAEARQRVVAALGEPACTEGRIILSVDVLGIELEAQPRLELARDLGGEVVALVLHLGIAQDAVLGIVAARDVVLRALASARDAEVVALLVRPVLIVEGEVVDITHTLLRVLEGRVHHRVLRQLCPGVYTGGVSDVALQQLQLLIAIETGRARVTHTCVPVLGELVGVDHLGQQCRC